MFLHIRKSAFRMLLEDVVFALVINEKWIM